MSQNVRKQFRMTVTSSPLHVQQLLCSNSVRQMASLLVTSPPAVAQSAAPLSCEQDLRKIKVGVLSVYDHW